jgi:NitT/TauT family transport system substrate-binding protein
MALAAGLPSVSGCAPRHATRRNRLAIGVRTANDHAPFYVADRHGLYRGQGLDVAVHVMGGNTEIIEALQRRDLQMGAVPVTTALAAIERGSPLRIVAMTGRGSDGLLVRRDDPAVAVADLRGRRVATIRASILDVLLRHALAGAGLDPHVDIEPTYMQGLGDLAAALRAGQVDACSNTEPFMTDATRRGWGRVLLHYNHIWPDHPCCVVLAHDDLARERPDVLRAALTVHRQAVDWCNGHPGETAAVIADVLSGFDVDVVYESLVSGSMRIDYHIESGEIGRMATLMAEQGLMDPARLNTPWLDPAPLRDVLEGAL